MTPTDKTILKALVAVAWADGKVAQPERGVIDGLLAGFGASADEEKEIHEYASRRRTLGDIPVGEMTQDDKETLLANAALLTHADGDQSDEEKKLLDRLVEILGFDERTATEIIDGAKDGALALSQRALTEESLEKVSRAARAAKYDAGSMRTSLTLASLLCASFVAVASPLAMGVAHAAPPGSGVEALQVLEVATDDADDQAKALSTALKARIRASKTHSVGEASLSLSVLSLSLKCGDVPDAKCQDKIGDKIKANAYIWGTMKKAPNHQVVADMHLWRKGQADVRQQFSLDDKLTDPLDPTLQKEAEQIFVRLTQFGKVGVARVEVDKGSGELFVDGENMGTVSAAAPLELTVPNGDHTFELRSAGKVVASGKATINPNTPAEVKLAAVAGGVAGGPVAGGNNGGGSGAATGGNDGSWKKTAGYVGIGAGVVFLGVGVFAGVKNKSASNDDGWKAYKGVASNKSQSTYDDACDAAKAGFVVRTPGALSPADAKSKCDSAKTFQALQYVMYPLGVIAAGAGVYFLATAPKDDGSPKTVGQRLQITPVTGPTYNGLDARFAF